MTDVAFEILADADDGYCGTNGDNFQSSGFNTWIGRSSSRPYQSWYRFDNVTIPAGAVIESAVIRFTCYDSRNQTVLNNIYFEDEDDPDAPTDWTDLNSRSLGSGVTWDPSGQWDDGDTRDTSDISSILQDIIDRAGWNSGQAVQVHVVDDGTSSGQYYLASDWGSGESAQLVITYGTPYNIAQDDSVEISESVSIESDLIREENISIQEGIEALLGFDESLPLISQGVAISEFVAFELEFTGEVEETESVGLSVYRNVELEGPKISVVENVITISEAVLMVPIAMAHEGIGIAEEITVRRGFDAFVSDSFDFADAFEAFNYSAWLKANLSVAKLRFFCTITGAADLQPDVEIPIKSFYARKKSGDPSYLQVVIAGAGYAGAVANRPNGALILEIGYEVAGVVSLREQIAIVDIDEISIYDGGDSRSITVAGHRTTAYTNNYIEINRKLAVYHGFQKNVLSYRFAFIDPYLNPGDTLIVGETAMTVENVIYIVGPLRSTMHVSEA